MQNLFSYNDECQQTCQTKFIISNNNQTPFSIDNQSNLTSSIESKARNASIVIFDTVSNNEVLLYENHDHEMKE